MRMLSWILLFSISAPAEVLDRVAVSISNEAITESEVVLEARLTAFLNGVAPDLAPASRRQAATRLIEQRLIRKELEASQYAEPGPADAEAAWKQIAAARFNGPEELAHKLREADLSEDAVRRHLLWQISVLRFLDLRFRPAVTVTEREVRDFFEKRIAPELRQAGDERTFEEMRTAAERALIAELADKQLDAWLTDAKARVRIRFREESFAK